MSLVPAQSGPMKFLPSGSSAKKIVQYLGYNWFLCAKHVEAIKKIDQTANQTIEKSHLGKKSYHVVMICLEALPLVGHLASAIEALLHSVEVKKTRSNLADKKYGIDTLRPKEFKLPQEHSNFSIDPWISKISQDPNKFEEVPEELRENEYFAYEAVNEKGINIALFSEKIKKNKPISLRAVMSDICVFNSVDKSLQTDKAFLLACIEEIGEKFFKTCISRKLQNSYPFCLQAVARNGAIYALLPKEFQSRVQMVLEAFADYVPYREDSPFHEARAKVFNSIPEEYKNNTGHIREILKRNGLVLEYLDKEKQNNPTLALIAIENNYRAYNHASEKLKGENNFCFQAYIRNSKIYSLLPNHIKKSIGDYYAIEIQTLTGWNLTEETD